MLLWALGAAWAADSLVVVIAADSPVADLSSTELRRLFQGYPIKGPDGTRLVPINQPPASEARVAFDERVLGMSPSEVGRYWVDRRIRDGSTPPRTQGSEEVLVSVVAKLPGAVSYAWESSVTADVKVLSIDGIAANEPGNLLAGVDDGD
jgi:ABC-type phosphate transport system substrate-binding protein